MGCTLLRRLGAIHVTLFAWFQLNVIVLESIRPLDHSQEEKVLPKQSLVEVGTHHLSVADKTSNSSAEGTQHHVADKISSSSVDDSSHDAKSGKSVSVARQQAKRPPKSEDDDMPPSDGDMPSDGGGGYELDEVHTGNAANDGDTAVNRVGSLVPTTFSSISGPLGGKNLDHLDEMDDADAAARRFDPSKEAPRSIYDAPNGSDSLWVNVEQQESSGGGNGHFVEAARMQDRVKSAVDHFRHGLSVVKESANGFQNGLESIIVPLENMKGQFNEIKSAANGFKDEMKADADKRARKAEESLTTFGSEGPGGSMNGRKWVKNLGQWNVFRDFLQWAQDGGTGKFPKKKKRKGWSMLAGRGEDSDQGDEEGSDSGDGEPVKKKKKGFFW